LKITLSHPHGSLFSYHAARALSERDWLQGFQTGVINRNGFLKIRNYLPGDAGQRLLNRNYEAIPEHSQHSHLFWETISRLGKAIKPAGFTSKTNWYDVLFCGHDLQVSRALESGLDAIYAYEDGAKRTFTAAKRRGALTIYELPAGYYKGPAAEFSRARKECPEFISNYKVEPDWKQKRKNRELELADVVVAPSTWAGESLRYSKFSGKKPLIVAPYGTPSNDVSPRNRKPSGPFTVLFAGRISLGKGVPYLLKAWQRLGLPNARLWLAGSMNLDGRALADHSTNFQHLGHLPRIKLLEVMKEADLFIFPSVTEGLALVLGEAMSVGLPVLTTINTGGTELITDGREGWCVPAHDVNSLMERVEWARRNRDALYEMGILARRRAEQWTWADYRRKLTEELSRHLSI
jgi:starch synthase